MQPNVIFVVLDTLRGDRICTLCNGRNLTPFIQSILKNSIYFENCIANSPWTLPSHISMFTGLFSTQNALISNDLEKVSPKLTLLPEVMKELGYFTIGYIENPWVSEVFGLTRGFDKCYGNDTWINNYWNREKYLFFFLFKILNILNSKIRKINKLFLIKKVWNYIFSAAIKFIKDFNLSLFKARVYSKLKDNSIGNLKKLANILNNSKEKKPVFFFLNFLTTHDPYIPIINNSNSSNELTEDFKIIKEMIIDPIKYRVEIDLNRIKLLHKEILTIDKLYNYCVSSADFVIKNLFTLLNRLKILDNTYVIITSDHGEHLGGKEDHNLWEHSTYYSLYDGVLKVPLVIYNKSFKQKIISNQVQLKDLFHTVLDLTGVDLTKSKYYDKHKSILYQINNNLTPKYIYGEYIKSRREYHLVAPYIRQTDKDLLRKINTDLYFLRTNNYKYIRHNNLEIDELYDLVKDPHEQVNLSLKKPEKKKELKSFFDNIRSKIKDVEELKNNITIKEQKSIKSVIKSIQFKGI